MSYTPPLKAEETGFVTTALLANGATFTSSAIDVNGYSQVQTEILASHDGTISISFCADSGCTDVVRSLSIPYLASNGYQFFAAPAFGNFIKYEFTNTGGVTQTDFYYTTKILTTAISPQLLTTDAFIAPAMVAELGRSITVGSNPSGTLINEKTPGVSFVTGATLAIGGTYSSDIINAIGYQQVSTAVVSDVDGTATFEFLIGPTGPVIRTLNVNYAASTGFQLLSAPAFTDYVRYSYTNGATAQSSFHYETKMLTGSLSGQVLPLNSPIFGGMVANLGANVIIGQEADGGYENVSVTETTNDSGVYHNLNVVSGARPSQLSGRVETEVIIDGATADTIGATVTAAKTFYVTDMILTINNAANAVGRINLRDGNSATDPIKVPILIGDPGSGGDSVLSTVTMSFNEPLPFTSGVFIDVVTGTLTIAGTLIGYEE